MMWTVCSDSLARRREFDSRGKRSEDEVAVLWLVAIVSVPGGIDTLPMVSLISHTTQVDA